MIFNKKAPHPLPPLLQKQKIPKIYEHENKKSEEI
jgi:hypothetical protein